jgi:putative membrane protein
MANERTVLAYIRTALSILVFGVAVHKFYAESPLSSYIFPLSVIFGLAIIFYGFLRFYKIGRKTSAGDKSQKTEVS